MRRSSQVALLFPVLAALALGAEDAARSAPEDPPVVPGLSREGLEPPLRGLVLLGELGCTNCHAPGPREEMISTRRAPDLRSVGGRVRPDYLKAFIAWPHRVKPGTVMPDVLGPRGDEVREDAAEALTHYLLSPSEERFSVQAPDRVAAAKGRELFHAIGCVACHSPRDEAGAELSTGDSAPLGRLERKYSVASLAAFLEMPLRARPSGRMPDFHLPPGEAYQIANYLTERTRVPGALRYTLFLDVTGEGLDGLDGKEREAGLRAGFDLGGFESYREDFALRFDGYLDIPREGEFAFALESSHVARLMIDGRPLISLTESGRGEATVRLTPGLHAIELAYLHARGQPELHLEWSGPGVEKGPIPAALLRSEESPAEPFSPLVVDPDKAAKGKALFAELRCGRCHRMEPAQAAAAPEMSKLNPAGGCLSGEAGSWPHYTLEPRQVEEMRAALASTDFEPTPEQRIRARLATFNCTACHARGDLGGIPESRNDYFLSDDPNLGETGRIPPPLTGVGAKLQREWLRGAIANGQSLRPYLSLRMPGFGSDNAEPLADLLARQDRVPAVVFEPLPRDGKKARAIRDMGRELVGEKGMNCVACHTFSGHRSGTMAAIDLVETTTQRLRKEWFYHYMLSPASFRSITIMPQYFPEGVSILKDVAGGDPKSQLGAMWHYLSEGRNAPRPRGLGRPPMEIVVGDEAVMLRRSAQDTGKRAISVGYPLGVNLTFDAESVSLNQIWRGKFIDPVGVWTGQGSGAVRILSRDRVPLVDGPAFAELAVVGHDEGLAPWPDETSRALGVRFKGYELDEVRRPTFLYVYRDIVITDKPMDRKDGRIGGGYLERTLTLRGAEDRTLYFRAAVNAELEETGDGRATIGRRVTIRASGRSGQEAAMQPLAFHIRPSAGPDAREAAQGGKPDREIIVPVEIRQGRATLVLEYRWLEAPG